MAKILISRYGNLYVHRPGLGLTYVKCPYTQFDTHCGLHCAKFRYEYTRNNHGDEIVKVFVCGDTVHTCYKHEFEIEEGDE